MRKLAYSAGIVLFAALLLSSCNKEHYRLYVGGYTEKAGDKGFSEFKFDPKTGALELVSESDAGPNPSYFCYSHRNKLFYVINEVMEFQGSAGGGLTVMKETADGPEKLTEMKIPVGGPCFVSLSHDSSHLFIANYPEGSVAVVKLNDRGLPETVTDTIIFCPASPDSSHAHMMLSDPPGRKAYISDLGLNTVSSFDFDNENGKLLRTGKTVTRVADGSGPRHFTFNAGGTKFYLINELGSTIMAFNVLEDGGLDLLQTVPTIKPDFKGENACADIHLSMDDRFLYGSNRGENSIVTFGVGEDGLLSLAGSTKCGGDWPRNFVIDPTGKYLLVGNERSDNISVFRIDENTGIPSELIRSAVSGRPVCLKIYKAD